MKTFLGDGVYVDFDGYHVILTTENGIRATNIIYLDPHVLSAFRDHIQQFFEEEDSEP